MSERFPAIPESNTSPGALLAAINALKQNVELLTGVRGSGELRAVLQGAGTRVLLALPPFERYQLPAATEWRGHMAYVSDHVGDRYVVVSNGTAWYYMDGTPVANQEEEQGHPGLASGFTEYYFSPLAFPSTLTGVVLANRAYFQPFLMPNHMVNRIGISVSAGVAGNCRLGFYTNNNGVPGTLILDAGVVSTASAVVVEASFTTRRMPRSWFWAVAVFDAGPTIHIGTNNNGCIAGSNSYTAALRAFYATLTYGALPSTAPTITGSILQAPLIGLRKA